MLLDEARLAARIRHPNVVSTLGVSGAATDIAGFFIVMEYIEGDTLAGLLTNAHKVLGKLPVPVALRIVLDALAALGSAHALCDESGKLLNLVHRDVSPHNIIVGSDGVTRLTDFGIAKAEDRLTQTREGQIKGKLAYMAPEQAIGMQTDARSDLFAVGVILWECVMGRRLFRGETATATLHKLLRAEIPAPSSYDPALAPLDALLEQALSRTPEARFASAEAFARAIEAVAPLVGGVATGRAVARSLRQCSGSKLAHERALLESARRSLQPLSERAFSGVAATSGAPALPAAAVQVERGLQNTVQASGVFVNPAQRRTPSQGPVQRRTQAPTFSRNSPDSHGVRAERSPKRLPRLLLVAALAAGAFYLSFRQARSAATKDPSVANAAQSSPAPERAATRR
jgi:serine/threonine-protein kinase